MAYKQSMMTRLRKGKFAEDEIQDYLQNKENKALIFTNKHLIYVSIERQEVRWSFSLENLSSVSTTGKALASRLIYPKVQGTRYLWSSLILFQYLDLVGDATYEHIGDSTMVMRICMNLGPALIRI